MPNTIPQVTDAKYGQRIGYIIGEINDVNAIFPMPAHFRENDLLALRFTAEAAEAVNSTIPSTFTPEEVKDRVNRITTTIKRKQRSQGWPSIALWNEAAEAEEQVYRKRETQASKPQAPQPGEFGSPEFSEGLEAKRIKEGKEAVPETYVWGSGYHRLIASGQITEDDIQPYRKWSRWSMEQLYGPEKTDRLIEEKIRHGLSVAKDDDPSPQRREQMQRECERLTQKLGKQMSAYRNRPKPHGPKEADLQQMGPEEMLEYCKTHPTKPRQETIDRIASKT